MKIIIYGSEGCSKCEKTKQIVEEVVKEMDFDAEVEKLNDPVKAAEKGIMSLPAVTFDGEVEVKGAVPAKKEIKEIIDNV